jgi:hypothetical protein
MAHFLAERFGCAQLVNAIDGWRIEQRIIVADPYIDRGIQDFVITSKKRQIPWLHLRISARFCGVATSSLCHHSLSTQTLTRALAAASISNSCT